MTPMTPLDLTPADQSRLEIAQLDRFAEDYPVPKDAIVLLTYDDRLILTVFNSAEVDWLLEDLGNLKTIAYLIFGVVEVAIVFAGEEVISVPTIANEVNSKESTLPPTNMSTATLERALAATEAPVTPANVYTSVDELTAQMSAITGRPIEEWRSQFINSSALFVPTSAAAEMIAVQINQLQAMLGRLQSQPTAEATPNGKAPVKTAAKTAAKRKAPAKKAEPTAS